ncbi:hypothetical protein DY000_02029701 [Brassica cretica]|uniref:DUF4283 domain-containing protein n=1 Tax=Brassica cretica TaxID=69181 RepID=A0ABQ7DMY4_BRACR|nr:hypothetical protein DY000_02029701 [Brassica cretica]
MPAQWKMHDRITANDLGNGKFLLNFVNEEDLQSVLRQGPFHFNFCMNLRNIGNRLGHIDTVELTAGRMLIDVDTRKPLTFTRKIASPEGDEAVNTQGDRTGVFARVQLPMNEVSRQSFLRDKKPFEKCDHSGRFDYGTTCRLSNLPKRKDSHADGFMKDARVSHYRNDAQNYRHGREHSGYDDKYVRRACGFDRKVNNKPPHRNSRYAPFNVLLTTLQTFWSIMIVRVVEGRLQIIDALNDMEIIGTSNIEGDPYETAMVGEDHDDDFLGDALLDMEDSVMNDAEEMVDTSSREKADTAKTEKSKALSYKSGGLSGIPLGLQRIRQKIHSGYEVKVWEDPCIPTTPARSATPVAPVMHPNIRSLSSLPSPFRVIRVLMTVPDSGATRVTFLDRAEQPECLFQRCMTGRHIRRNAHGELVTFTNQELSRLERQNRQQQRPNNTNMGDQGHQDDLAAAMQLMQQQMIQMQQTIQAQQDAAEQAALARQEQQAQTVPIGERNLPRNIPTTRSAIVPPPCTRQDFEIKPALIG